MELSGYMIKKFLILYKSNLKTPLWKKFLYFGKWSFLTPILLIKLFYALNKIVLGETGYESNLYYLLGIFTIPGHLCYPTTNCAAFPWLTKCHSRLFVTKCHKVICLLKYFLLQKIYLIFFFFFFFSNSFSKLVFQIFFSHFFSTF